MASTARLDELKKKFDENPRRYFAPLANEHRKSGDLDQAIALCRAHLPQQPAHISGHIVLAQALFEAGSLDEARENFHSALGLDPENLIALRYLGDIARDADDVETARSWYQRVLEVDPRNDEIVQIVRELDMPRAERTEVAEAEPPTSQPVAETTAPVAPPAAPAVATNDARFAPISLDSLELDESLDTAPASSSDDHATSQAPGRDSSDDSTWTAESPAMELPVLDTAGIDPFDMDPAASADALFDVHASSSSADDLLSELSASSHVSSGLRVTMKTSRFSSRLRSSPSSSFAAAAGNCGSTAMTTRSYFSHASRSSLNFWPPPSCPIVSRKDPTGLRPNASAK